MDISTLLALLALPVAALLAHRLARARERATTRRVAAEEFHKAFDDTLLNLENSEMPTARIVREFDVQHKSAIERFRPYVEFQRRKKFEREAQRLEEICSGYRNVGLLGMFSTEIGEVARENRAAMIKTIRALRSTAPLM